MPVRCSYFVATHRPRREAKEGEYKQIGMYDKGNDKLGIDMYKWKEQVRTSQRCRRSLHANNMYGLEECNSSVVHFIEMH